MPTNLRSFASFERDEARMLHPTRKGITRLTVDVPAPRNRSSESKPARWNTAEFYLYYVLFIVTVPWMIWVPISLSQGEYTGPRRIPCFPLTTGFSFSSKL
jgi:protein-cysteine N-palmitoyltransferase HHAT